MPIDYIIMDKGSLVHAHGYGTIQASDVVAHEQRLLADSRVTPGFRQLLDCRWVSDETIADDLLRSLANVHEHAGSKVYGARYAVVAHGAQWFNLGSQYRCGEVGVTLIVFNDPGTACIWLGANYPDLAGHWLNVPVPTSSRTLTSFAPAS